LIKKKLVQPCRLDTRLHKSSLKVKRQYYNVIPNQKKLTIRIVPAYYYTARCVEIKKKNQIQISRRTIFLYCVEIQIKNILDKEYVGRCINTHYKLKENSNKFKNNIVSILVKKILIFV